MSVRIVIRLCVSISGKGMLEELISVFSLVASGSFFYILGL